MLILTMRRRHRARISRTSHSAALIRCSGSISPVDASSLAQACIETSSFPKLVTRHSVPSSGRSASVDDAGPSRSPCLPRPLDRLHSVAYRHRAFSPPLARREPLEIVRAPSEPDHRAAHGERTPDGMWKIEKGHAAICEREGATSEVERAGLRCRVAGIVRPERPGP